MKKIITSLLTIIILFQFCLSPNVSYASEAETSTGGSSGTGIYEMLQSGTANKGDKANHPIVDRNTDSGKVFDLKSNTMSTIATILCSVLNFIPMAVSMVISVATMDVLNLEEGFFQFFTIQDLVFGNISLLDINFLGKDNNGTTKNGKEVNSKIKENVAIWYYAVRNIAIAISLLMLVYVGIRMSISTIASDKAKYKEMLKYWAISFILLFTLQYIVSAIFYVYSIFMNLITENFGVANQSLAESIVSGSSEENANFEHIIMKQVLVGIKTGQGIDLLGLTISYWVLTFYQVRFLLLYVKRYITIGFLIAIAPAITVTYTIDKMGDKRAQAFETWKRELMINILIQPLHAIMYVIFVTAAGAIAEQAPILAIAFFMALSRAEKVVKGIFDMRNASTINSMSETIKLGKK